MARGWQAASRFVETKTDSFGEEEFSSIVNSGKGEEIMKEFLKILAERFRKKIKEMKIGHEGDLQDSFRGTVKKSSSEIRGRMNYNYYGRFVNLGVGKGVTLAEMKSGVSLTKGRKGKTTRRKPKPWYSDTLPYETHRLSEIYAEAVSVDAGAKLAAQLNAKIEIKV